MSITNAPTPKKKLTLSFFEKNSPLLKLINTHNKYIDLYSTGNKTEDGIALAILEDTKSSSFYQDVDIKNIIERCLVIQTQCEEIMREIQKAQILERRKDSYWENMDSSFTMITGAIGLGFTLGGLIAGAGLLCCGVAGLGALVSIPIIITGIGIISLTAALIQTALDQKQAKDEYFKIFQQTSEPHDSIISFFNIRKEPIDQEIEGIVLPQYTMFKAKWLL